METNKTLTVDFMFDSMDSIDEIENLLYFKIKPIACQVSNKNFNFLESLNIDDYFTFQYKHEYEKTKTVYKVQCTLNNWWTIDFTLEEGIEDEIEEENLDNLKSCIENYIEVKYFIKDIEAKGYSQGEHQTFYFCFNKKDKDSDEVKMLERLKTAFTRSLVHWNFTSIEKKTIQWKIWQSQEILETYWMCLNEAFFEKNEEEEYINEMLSNNKLSRTDFDNIIITKDN